MTAAPPPKSILIVTGLSGAGKSSTLRTLEDLGWEVVDNLPLSLLTRLLAAPQAEGQREDGRPLAIGMDSRTRGFDGLAFVARLERLKAERRNLEVLFLDCAGSVLEQRYAETRRRHPLALDRPAADGIAREREVMAPIRRVADHLIDSSDLTVNALQQQVRQRFGGSFESTLTLVSFGFARGVPRNADLLFDVRFLRNPYWVGDLREKTGLDADVAAYVEADPLYTQAIGQIEAFLKTVLPRYSEDGKSYVTIAFGCTGGRHRSVRVTEDIGERLRHAGFSPTISHRNLESAQLDAYENRRSRERAETTKRGAQAK